MSYEKMHTTAFLKQKNHYNEVFETFEYIIFQGLLDNCSIFQGLNFWKTLASYIFIYHFFFFLRGGLVPFWKTLFEIAICVLHSKYKVL